MPSNPTPSHEERNKKKAARHEPSRPAAENPQSSDSPRSIPATVLYTPGQVTTDLTRNISYGYTPQDVRKATLPVNQSATEVAVASSSQRSKKYNQPQTQGASPEPSQSSINPLTRLPVRHHAARPPAKPPTGRPMKPGGTARVNVVEDDNENKVEDVEDDEDEDEDEDGDEEEGDFNEFPFTNLTSEICRLFVKIPLEEFPQRIQFLDDNRQLLAKGVVEVIEIEFMKQSVEFCRMGKHAAAMSCILSLALLRVSKGQKQLTPFFRNLLVQESDEKKGYSEIVRALNGIVEHKAKQEGSLPLPQRKSSGRSDIGTLKISDLFQQDINEVSSNYIGTGDDINEASVPEKLSPKYKVRKNAKEFFVPGKVFAILWTEATSKRMATEDLLKPRKNESLSVVRFGEIVFTHIRRMVVVRSRKGSSWCVSIGTYEGQGLSKPGLKEDDIAVHTAIYDIKKGVSYLPNEPRSNRRAIGVKMINGETLDPASRVHLGKPYNVEWNVKVMDVGQVTEKDLPALLVYVKDVMGV